MRLTKIKLAGFKSFVDPVSIPVNASLVGIVGPNGCGKSNIIDAVRWVMGESSAKHLRGGTMADVIFNGSATRKPVGLASVELVFDNSNSDRGGAYAAYNTIAIKRQVSRDGQSVYMLNGSKCRRKDITDIFLGTGLGTRSYAIIEQGTISRLVEAKPDDLRYLIEEAAGISLYKDRRHDTEIRIRHTRENLDRLNDLREEVDKQIRHLKQQAKKAESYKILKAEERQLRRELLAIRWQAFRAQVEANVERETRAKEELDQAQSLHGDLERQINRSRQEQNQFQQALNAVQADLYASTAGIARLDQTIQTAEQSREDIEAELARLSSEKQRALSELDADKQQLAKLQREIVGLNESSAHARQLQAASSRLQRSVELEFARQQGRLDSIRNEIAAQNQLMTVEQARIDQFTVQDQQHRERAQRLNAEKAELEKQDLSMEIEQLSERVDDLEMRRESVREHLAELKQRSDRQKLDYRELNQSLNEIRSKMQSCEGKIASLERLQQHAIGKDRSPLNQWLKQHGLEDAKRLAQDIEVENGWDKAVELVLSAHLEAVCVDDATRYLEELADLCDETLVLTETGAEGRDNPPDAPSRLASMVRSNCKVGSILDAIYCAGDLDHARALRSGLKAGESVITADGIWLGKGWLYLNRSTDQKSGVLAREKELRALKENLRQLQSEAECSEESLDALEREIHNSASLYEEQQIQERMISGDLSDQKATLGAKSTRQEHIIQRIAQIEREIGEIGEIAARNEASIGAARNTWNTAEAALGSLSAQIERDERLNRSLEECKGEILRAAAEARDEMRRIEARLNTLQSSEQLTNRHLNRLADQHEQEIQRGAQLERKLAEVIAPIQENFTERESLIEQRKQYEDILKQERARLTDCEKATTNLCEHLHRNQMEIEKKREKLEKARLDGQESRVRSESVLEQLDELNVERDAIAALLPEFPDEALWMENIEQLGEKIARLGSINLAAIEEFEEQSKRLDYLNEQHADLSNSLQILEQAIKKIDLESQTRFKSTFDQINSGLQVNFPKLFGGGQASLELTDDDLLESGVNVIARPPGKRNASIHLLSGGEKALTAVALVFSIFELNPAPFCMLDEVDAPLDDANVGRFSRLIEEMAERVQFIFITHNKVTMEIARQLAGVTMNEPGVSRLVAVDIDEAVELAVS